MSVFGWAFALRLLVPIVIIVAVAIPLTSSASLRAALARVRRAAPGARVALLRIDATSFSVTASRLGHLQQIYFGPVGTVITPGNTGGQLGVPLSKIKPDAVTRMVNDMQRRFHVPARKIDYIVLVSPPGLGPSWALFTKTPAHTGYQAALSGAGLKRLRT